MLRDKYLAYLFLIAFSVLLTASDRSNATSCGDEHRSIEESYIYSSVVLYGEVVNEDSLAVKELYKFSKGHFDKEKPMHIYTSPASEHPEKMKDGDELVIYGYVDETNDEYRLYLSSSCGQKSKISPKQKIRELRAWSGNPETLTDKNSASGTIVFTGRVKAAQHREYDIAKSHPRKIIQSEIDFEVTELFKNETKKQHLEDIETVNAKVYRCGQLFQVGREYLVTAEPNMVGYKKPDGKTGRRREGFVIDCSPFAFSDLNELDLLRQLSGKKFNKESENGD